MLKKIKTTGAKKTKGRFAIVASKYNARYVDAMLNAATALLTKAGAKEVKIIRVPGAFEIPVVVSRLTETAGAPDAIICLGVILRGATTHAQVVSEVVSQQLGDLAVRKQVPVIHEVLLLENEQQARERCLSKTHNRGAEAATTAIEMVALMARLPKRQDDVPF
jgi:6,7-dimethyl-8-ribityllumazine synthase